MLTKTQIGIVKLLVSQITRQFGLREIGRLLDLNPSLIHRSIKPLIKQKIIRLNEKNLISLNYFENHETLSYAEYLRRNDFFERPQNSDLSICLKDFVSSFREEGFILLIFGSVVNKSNPNDVDILLIVDSEKKVESGEKLLNNIARSYGLDDLFHIMSISYESVYEMLKYREEKNVMNEILNKHIVVYGADLLYRILSLGRR